MKSAAMRSQSEYDVTYQENGAEDQLSAVLHSAIQYGTNLQNSLDDIKDNTRRLFWWTSTLVCICLGLFLLGQLLRLRKELIKLVRYQEQFHRMWYEDREIEIERIEEQRRERQLEERRRQARYAARGRASSSDVGRDTRRRTPMGSPRLNSMAEEPYASTSQYQRLSPFGSQVNAALDTAPLQGVDRDEWVRKVASMTQGLRREHYEKRSQGEEDGDEEDSIYS
ncbi:uncharacterized protein F4812DRAFT_422510 [Daldinia caldariorum]|uniref:uncharacterized protein n=1 Tax=Daldinia caldariorum TaxID=326644 RepID=UPI0020079215|nr:uncharacterized protein F4812DRAFT_422510 [Daldinia caldariorum]KAI1469247.1 hypothetical protein F4812DRAFT_422510 [Daldinia caldariorum]